MKAFIIDGGYGKYKAIPKELYDADGNEVDWMESGYFLLEDEDDKIFVVERNGVLYHSFPSLDMLNWELEEDVAEALKKDGYYFVQLDDDEEVFDDDWGGDERYREYRLIVINV